MHSSGLVTLVPWVISHGYLLFFMAAFIEGPLVTAAGGVAAALGYYDIYIIMLLSIAGDAGGDFFYYGIGYTLNKLIKSGRLRFLGITIERVEKIEKLLHHRTSQAIIFVKLTPLIGPAGLMILGSVRASFKKLIKIALTIAIPKSVMYALLGFYSAAAYVYLDKTIARGENALMIIIGVAIAIYFLFQKISALIAKRMDK
ncbi:MAG: hypothetical protein WC467_01705 [Patescibacteria group bacterium]